MPKPPKINRYPSIRTVTASYGCGCQISRSTNPNQNRQIIEISLCLKKDCPIAKTIKLDCVEEWKERAKRDD